MDDGPVLRLDTKFHKERNRDSLFQDIPFLPVMGKTASPRSLKSRVRTTGGPAILAGSGSCHVYHSRLFLHLYGNFPLLTHKNRPALILRLQLKLPEACLHKTFQIIHRFLRGEILVECLLSDKLLCLKMQGAFR